jgi:hypothetical protein
MNEFSAREQVVEVINRLFYYTDHQDWDQLKAEVFAENVLLDMTSMGAESAELLSPEQICKMWAEGFKDLHAIHHQAGTHIISLNGPQAEAKCYAIASHYRKDASQGSVREFVGSYDFRLTHTAEGWRIDRFKYNLKYADGNVDFA